MHGQSQGATILSESTLQQQEREQLLKKRNQETIKITGIQDDEDDLDLQEESHRVNGGARRGGVEGS